MISEDRGVHFWVAGRISYQSGEGSLTPTAEVDWKRKIRYSTVYEGLLF